MKVMITNYDGRSENSRIILVREDGEKFNISDMVKNYSIEERAGELIRCDLSFAGNVVNDVTCGLSNSSLKELKDSVDCELVKRFAEEEG